VSLPLGIVFTPGSLPGGWNWTRTIAGLKGRPTTILADPAGRSGSAQVSLDFRLKIFNFTEKMKLSDVDAFNIFNGASRVWVNITGELRKALRATWAVLPVSGSISNLRSPFASTGNGGRISRAS
jgi:hypothetical protein